MPARYFGGTAADRLDFGDDPPFNPAGAFTLHVRLLPLSRNANLVSKWQSSVDRSFLLEMQAGATLFNILGTNDSGYGANNGPPLRLGVWSSVAAMYTGSAVDCRVNGISGGTTASVAIKNSSMGVRVGDRADNSIPFKGWMRDLATWDAALSTAELDALTAGASPLTIRRGSLSGYWPLGENLAPLWNTTTPTRSGVVAQTEGEPVRADVLATALNAIVTLGAQYGVGVLRG